MRDSLSAQASGEIRAALARRRMTQRDLAASIGVSEKSMSRYLTDQRPLTINTLGAIADALGVEPASILIRFEGA